MLKKKRDILLSFLNTFLSFTFKFLIHLEFVCVCVRNLISFFQYDQMIVQD